jgi:hypothetical protein
MNDPTEKRHEKRINISCELRFRSLDSDQFYEVECIDLSSSGVSFYSQYSLHIGEEVEVEVIHPPIWFSTKFMIKVVRVEHQDNELFKIGAYIEYEE